MHTRKFELQFHRLAFAAMMLGFTIQAALSQGYVGRDKLSDDMVELLKHPIGIEVYSLDAKETKANPNFHGWKVFGSTAVSAQQAQNAIGLQLLEQTNPKSVHYCGFRPHHGVSILSRKHRLDYVICFHCSDIHIFWDGEYWNHGTLDSPNASLEALLNAALKAKKVGQAPDYTRDFADRQHKEHKLAPLSSKRSQKR
jgi:hypothetical protein